MTEAPAAVPATSQARKKALLGFSVVVLALAFAGWNVIGCPVKLRYPGELNFIEGMPLAEMVHLRQGVPIYAPASAQWYDAANFGPLYYLVGARLVDPVEPSYLPLRLLSTLGTLGCAVGCGLLAYWLAQSYLAAVLAPLLFLSFGFVIRHGASARSDIVALFLVFAGFLVAFKFRCGRTLLLATPLLLAGFYYKQQFVAAPLAILVFLLLERRYRPAAEFAGLMVLGGLCLLGLFQFVVFTGQVFLHHFVFYNVLPFMRVELVEGLLFFGMLLLIPLLVGLEFLRLNPDRLLMSYLICAVLLSLLTVSRAGSDTYYFLECIIILCPLFAALVAKRIEEPDRAVELVILLIVTLFVGQWFRTPTPTPKEFGQDRAAQDYFRRHFLPGTRVLSYYTGDMVRSGLQTPITNLYHYNQLVRKGALNDREMVTQLETHYFGVVVVDFDLQTERESYWLDFYLTERIRRAIQANYHLAATVEMPGPEKLREEARFYVWVPNTPARAAVPPGPEAAQPVRGR